MMRKFLPALALLLGACQDLDVVNPNEPDRDRATRQPAATESFVASSFRPWWRRAGHDDYPSWAFSTISQEVTSGFSDFGELELSEVGESRRDFLGDRGECPRRVVVMSRAAPPGPERRRHEGLRGRRLARRTIPVGLVGIHDVEVLAGPQQQRERGKEFAHHCWSPPQKVISKLPVSVR